MSFFPHVLSHFFLPPLKENKYIVMIYPLAKDLLTVYWSRHNLGYRYNGKSQICWCIPITSELDGWSRRIRS